LLQRRLLHVASSNEQKHQGSTCVLNTLAPLTLQQITLSSVDDILTLSAISMSYCNQPRDLYMLPLMLSPTAMCTLRSPPHYSVRSMVFFIKQPPLTT
jgi:hypothetical protein